MDFGGHNIVLTGVGRPGQTGEAVARAFAEHGARVLLVSRRDEDARSRADELLARGLQAAAFAADLTDPAAVSALAERVRDASEGHVHALVHVAGGFSMSGPVADSEPAEWNRLFAINATTAYLTARAMLPLLRAMRGAVVFFASEVALPGAPVGGLAAYVAAKSAVVSLTRVIAEEERTSGVRANAVAPGLIRTADTLAVMGRDAAGVTCEAVAEVVLWLCSEAARAVSGQVIAVR